MWADTQDKLPVECTDVTVLFTKVNEMVSLNQQPNSHKCQTALAYFHDITFNEQP